MLTSIQAIKRYGSPLENQIRWEGRNMVLFDLDDIITKVNPVIPSRIYVHRDFGPVINRWFLALLHNALLLEIKTWNGIFNVRKKRGLSSLSLHAFGLAVDLNASHNPLGLTREQCKLRGLEPFSEAFIDLSREYVDCGADWKSRPDLMHFQMKGFK